MAQLTHRKFYLRMNAAKYTAEDAARLVDAINAKKKEVAVAVKI